MFSKRAMRIICIVIAAAMIVTVVASVAASFGAFGY